MYLKKYLPKIIVYYFPLVRIQHFLIDLSVVLSILFVFSYYININSPYTATKNIIDIAKIIIPILTFQSTLHTTSIIFFANSNATVLEKLRNEYINQNGQQIKYKKIDQLYSYFSWSILVQLFFLLYTLLITVYLTNNSPEFFMIQYLKYHLFVLMFGVTYSIVLCLRNIGLFFSVLTYKQD